VGCTQICSSLAENTVGQNLCLAVILIVLVTASCCTLQVRCVCNAGGVSSGIRDVPTRWSQTSPRGTRTQPAVKRFLVLNVLSRF
jgi:hypothetical protein